MRYVFMCIYQATFIASCTVQMLFSPRLQVFRFKLKYFIIL